MIHATAPLRISFSGGGTDHPSFYSKHGGAVLSVAIKKYAHCVISTLRSATDQHVETMMRYWTDLPPGSGLGGSSAVAVAVIAAEDRRHGIERGRIEVGKVAERLERGHLGMAGGSQDSWPAALGGCNLWRFNDEINNPMVSPVTSDVYQPLAKWLMLCPTGQKVAKVTPTVSSPETTKSLKTMTALTHSMHDMLLKGEFKLFGYMLLEAWKLKKQSSPGCSTPRADLLLKTAVYAGAVGGKLCGSGGGGYLLLCADPSKHAGIRDALSIDGQRCEPVEFDEEGLKVEGTL